MHSKNELNKTTCTYICLLVYIHIEQPSVSYSLAFGEFVQYSIKY